MTRTSEPLDGVRVGVTRREDQATELAQLLAGTGAVVSVVPLIELAPLSQGPLRGAIEQLRDNSLVVITSSNAARAFFEALGESSTAPAPATLRFVAVGPATAAACTKYGGVQITTPPANEYSGAGITNLLPATESATPVFIIRGRGGDERLPDKLAASGYRVTTIDVYETISAPLRSDQCELLLSCDLITLASASAARALAEIDSPLVRALPVVCIGGATTSAASELGLNVSATGASATPNALVDACITAALRLENQR
jgi:uroporphyrinogen-III synthase